MDKWPSLNEQQFNILLSPHCSMFSPIPGIGNLRPAGWIQPVKKLDLVGSCSGYHQHAPGMAAMDATSEAQCLLSSVYSLCCSRGSILRVLAPAFFLSIPFMASADQWGDAGMQPLAGAGSQTVPIVAKCCQPLPYTIFTMHY